MHHHTMAEECNKEEIPLVTCCCATASSAQEPLEVVEQEEEEEERQKKLNRKRNTDKCRDGASECVFTKNSILKQAIWETYIKGADKILFMSPRIIQVQNPDEKIIQLIETYHKNILLHATPGREADVKAYHDLMRDAICSRVTDPNKPIGDKKRERVGAAFNDLLRKAGVRDCKDAASRTAQRSLYLLKALELDIGLLYGGNFLFHLACVVTKADFCTTQKTSRNTDSLESFGTGVSQTGKQLQEACDHDEEAQDLLPHQLKFFICE